MNDALDSTASYGCSLVASLALLATTSSPPMTALSWMSRLTSARSTGADAGWHPHRHDMSVATPHKRQIMGRTA